MREREGGEGEEDREGGREGKRGEGGGEEREREGERERESLERQREKTEAEIQRAKTPSTHILPVYIWHRIHHFFFLFLFFSSKSQSIQKISRGYWNRRERGKVDIYYSSGEFSNTSLKQYETNHQHFAFPATIAWNTDTL